MPVAEPDLRVIEAELQLLDEVVELALRCQDRVSPVTLDAVLSGTGEACSGLPPQRADRAAGAR